MSQTKIHRIEIECDFCYKKTVVESYNKKINHLMSEYPEGWTQINSYTFNVEDYSFLDRCPECTTDKRGE